MSEEAGYLPRIRAARGALCRALLGGLLATPACGGADAVELEVYSWWSQPSEALAFERVKKIHEERHPGVVVTNRADPNAPNQRERMASLLLAKAPPASFTANIGADLLRWAIVDTEPLSASTPYSWVQDLTGVLNDTGLLGALRADLREALAVGPSPELYGVPINIHRLNVLYYNVAVLDGLAKQRPGVDLLSIETLCPESGQPPDLPAGFSIAIGTDNDFALTLLAFENVLPAIAGPEFVDALFRGQNPSSVSKPGESYLVELRRALRCVQNLSPYLQPEQEWAFALRQVAEGHAALTVMGDWANGELSEELENEVVRALPFPGKPAFMFTSDTFPLPIGVEHEPEVLELLSTIASERAQREFSEEKGSIPAREDASISGKLADVRRRTRDDFVDPSIMKVLATSGRFPPYFVGRDIRLALEGMIAPDAGPEEIDAVLAEFDSQLPLLALWRERLSQGSAPPRGP